MELILDKVLYESNKDNNSLDNVTYTFREGINFLYGLNASLLKDILFQQVKPKKGYVMVNMEASRKDVSLVSLNEGFNKTNLLDEIYYLNEYYALNYEDPLDRIRKSMIMVGLNNYSNCYFSDLSSGELKKIKLAIALFLNSKIIILDYYDKGLSSKDREYLCKLLRKISKMYHKNIIICSDNINDYINVLDNIVIFKDGNIVCNKNKSELYDDDIYKYINMPDIIKMIKYLESNGHKFDHYIENNELLKAIFRDVENK